MEARSADLLRPAAFPAVVERATHRLATKVALAAVTLLVLFAMPLVVVAAEGLITARAIAAALLLGGFLVAAALYAAPALTLFRSSEGRPVARPRGEADERSPA
jgi:hypothetical protein